MEEDLLQPPAGRRWPRVLAAFLVLVGGTGVAGYYALDSWLHKESRAAEARRRDAEKSLRETQEFVKLRDEALLLDEITVRNGYSAEDVAIARRRLKVIVERIRETTPNFDEIVRNVEEDRLNVLEQRERARRARPAVPK